MALIFEDCGILPTKEVFQFQKKSKDISQEETKEKYTLIK